MSYPDSDPEVVEVPDEEEMREDKRRRSRLPRWLQGKFGRKSKPRHESSDGSVGPVEHPVPEEWEDEYKAQLRVVRAARELDQEYNGVMRGSSQEARDAAETLRVENEKLDEIDRRIKRRRAGFMTRLRASSPTTRGRSRVTKTRAPRGTRVASPTVRRASPRRQEVAAPTVRRASRIEVEAVDRRRSKSCPRKRSTKRRSSCALRRRMPPRDPETGRFLPRCSRR